MPKRTLPEPRSWLHAKNQPEFGRTEQPGPNWQTAQGTAATALRNAARAQHEFMLAVRNAIRADRTTTTKQIANDLDISVDQLRRLMRGEAQLLLVDMHRLAARLSIDIDTAVRSEPT